MNQSFDGFQKYGKEGFDFVLKSFGMQQKGAQAITSAVADYSKNLIEAHSSAIEKLSGVKTLDKAIEIQSDYTKNLYEGLVAHMAKVSELTSNIVKENLKTCEAVVSPKSK